jgi:MFS family permease
MLLFATIGGVFADRRDRRHMTLTSQITQMLIFLALLGTMTVGFALSRTVYVPALILFAAGSLLVMCFSLTTSLAQQLAPPALCGRVLSIYLVAFLGGLASG